MTARRATLIFMLLLGGLGAVTLVAALRLRTPRVATTSETALVFDVPATLDETEPPERRLALQSGRGRLTLFTVVDAITRAADDDKVGAIVLHVDGIDWGWAKLAEVRDALARFGEAGKPVYASLSGGGEAEYLLASSAHIVSMPPTARLQLDGLSASVMFLRGTFDKIGVSPNFVHVGRYKSAVEGYTRTGLSPPAREALEALLDDHYRLLVDSLATARGGTPEDIQAQMEEGPFEASEALERGLIDTLLYRVELDSLATYQGEERLSTLSFRRYAERARRGPHRGSRVALIGTEPGGRGRRVDPGRRNPDRVAARGARAPLDQGRGAAHRQPGR